MNTKTQKRVPLQKVVLVSFLVDITDVLANVAVAALSGSVTMLSQALEGIADLISSGLLLIGVRRSKHPADHKHPYGYGREMYFWTFMSGMVTFSLTATFSFYSGLQRYLHPEPIEHIPLAYTVLLFAMVTNGYALSLSYRRLLGKNSRKHILYVFKHSALIETKTTFVLDLMGTFASLVGLIALAVYGVTGNAQFDGIGAIMTGLILGIFALFILMGAKELLVGQSASEEIEKRIYQITKSFREVNDVLDIRTIRIGPETILVNLEVHLQDHLETDRIETLIDTIEQKIRSEIPHAKHIQIELETPDVL